MNRIAVIFLETALAAPGIAAADEREPPVAVRLDKVPIHARVQVEAKAQLGITELRNYVFRTRYIYNLNLRDIVVPEEAMVAKGNADARKLAERGKDGAK